MQLQRSGWTCLSGVLQLRVMTPGVGSVCRPSFASPSAVFGQIITRPPSGQTGQHWSRPRSAVMSSAIVSPPPSSPSSPFSPPSRSPLFSIPPASRCLSPAVSSPRALAPSLPHPLAEWTTAGFESADLPYKSARSISHKSVDGHALYSMREGWNVDGQT